MIRTLALQALLQQRGVVTGTEVAARIQGLQDAATVEQEFAPEYEDYRRRRAEI